MTNNRRKRLSSESRPKWATKANLSGHLRNWAMEQQTFEGGRVHIAWVEDDGGRRKVNIPTWLLTSIVQRVNERGMFYGLGTVIGGKPTMNKLIKKARARRK